MDGHHQRRMTRFLSCEFHGGDSEHVRTTAEVIREGENVGISSGRDRHGPKVVDTYGAVSTVG